jgi:hypothetical protein
MCGGMICDANVLLGRLFDRSSLILCRGFDACCNWDYGDRLTSYTLKVVSAFGFCGVDGVECN